VIGNAPVFKLIWLLLAGDALLVKRAQRLKGHIEGTSEPVDVDALDATFEAPAEAASPRRTNRHQERSG
jgi:hypothetical protein